MFSCREDDILWLKLKNLIVPFKGIALNVLIITKRDKATDTRSNLTWFEMGHRHFSHIKADSPVFINMDIIPRAEESFNKMLRKAVSVRNTPNAFNEISVFAKTKKAQGLTVVMGDRDRTGL